MSCANCEYYKRDGLLWFALRRRLVTILRIDR